ncbi:MAG: ATP-binding protein [Lachnospiraceae bacterium]
MNIQQAKQEIKHTVKAYLQKDTTGNYKIPLLRQRPILMMGPPGIGKTQIMEQIASECGIGLVAYTITHHTRQSAVGLPFIKEEEFNSKRYSITEYTMSEIIASIYKKMKDTDIQEGILFIDEINCVSETLAPTMLQFLQYKTFGNQAVPDGWIIVTAGNPPEYNKSVRDFDMVTLDRVRRMDLEPDLPAWKEYAREQGILPSILSYLDIRPKNFYRVESDVDGLSFVTARGWEDLSTLLAVYKELNIAVTEEIVSEFLSHEDVAQDFTAYYDLYRKYEDDYGISDILHGNVRPDIYARIFEAQFDERITVVHLLYDGLRQKFAKIYKTKTFVDEWFRELQMEQGQQNDSKEQFQEQAAWLEQMELEAETMLSQAFNFMEQAFENGQEMVVFVTELTMGAESASFLKDYPNEKYINYNRELLIGTKKAELLKELQE